MLSVLIPVYNFDVRSFVRSLNEQCKKAEVPFEILLYDDGSRESIRGVNRELKNLPNTQYLELENNLGRSAIRNRLVIDSQFDYLIFLDCDGACPDDQFIQRYIDQRDLAPVIYGGRLYPNFDNVDSSHMLHFTIGNTREVFSAESRMTNPYKSFMTNNFLVHKSAYEQVKMDEAIHGYGHEDTLFAIELRKQGIPIAHIDNPIIHIGLEAAEVFLDKTHQGVKNLARLINRKAVGESITLVRTYYQLRKNGLSGIVATVGSLFIPLLKQQLIGQKPTNFAFDSLKLIWLCQEMRKQ